jgi:hypothetical protein|tara:strand:- start:248 stop:487 length:240 start_codon:yes stop_codon:yes gene_type:complete
MLGFSLPKLIVLGLIVAVVWYGFKIFGSGRLASKLKVRDEDNQKATPEAVDMVQCGVCNDFVALKGTTFCGKEGCPHPQ